MSYASLQDLIDRFGEAELLQLTDPDQTGLIDEARVGVALSDAEREIDTYIGVRHDLPLSATPPLLVSLAADMARYKLYTHAPPEEITERYKAARALLAHIAKGQATLEGLSKTESARGIAVNAPETVFTAELMGKMP
jgi:phage gp36-like protein